jgi:hypothetical protein
MRWRTLKIALLLFQALWLNVIVPGHRRGQIALPGEACGTCLQSARETDDCCQTHRDSRGSNPHPSRGDPALHCALCYFAVRVTPPDPIDLTPPALRFCERSILPAPQICIPLPFLATYEGRAPPTIA